MKKLIPILILVTNTLFANLNVIVSILPQQTFVQAIGGECVNVSLMVQPASSIHTYEPKASQMVDVAKASLYFAIGVEFEEVWLPKFKNLNPHLSIIHLDDNIEKIPMSHEEHHTHHHGEDDLHIWTSPANVKIMAQTIYDTLSQRDKPNEIYYKQNLEAFLKKIEYTDQTIKKSLSMVKADKKFMVFHPSWGYFAKAYGLEQIVVEIEGKEPKPKALILLIKEAKKRKIKAIFTQPEFSDKVAHIIAKELHIPVVKISPLAPNWSQNLIDIAKSIAVHE